MNPIEGQEDSLQEMERVLRREQTGYLGLSKAGMPYVVPINYAYVEGKVLFHCSLQGSKLDHIRANPQVCFTVARQFGDVVRHPQGASCHLDSDSVICFGRARIVENLEERRSVLDAFNRCLRPSAEPIKLKSIETCYAVEISVTEMTGRTERDGKCVYWRHRM